MNLATGRYSQGTTNDAGVQQICLEMVFRLSIKRKERRKEGKESAGTLPSFRGRQRNCSGIRVAVSGFYDGPAIKWGTI